MIDWKEPIRAPLDVALTLCGDDPEVKGLAYLIRKALSALEKAAPGGIGLPYA